MLASYVKSFKMSIFSIKFIHQYSCRFCAFLVMLFNLVSGLPALAEDGHEGSPLTSMASFDQIVEAAPWSGHLPGIYFGSTPAVSFDAGTSQSGWGYNWKGPPAESPDWRGIKWDTAYFVAYQFAVVAILYLAPEKLSGWSQEDKENYSFSKWKENVSNPVWDDDEWWVNYILHPYWGATYYIRARERGLKQSHSFWYAVLLSTLYEFGAEAMFEPVSIQDLVVTPVAGALLGEYLFSPIRERVRAKDQLYWSDKTVLFITDPLGVVNAGVSRILGVNTQVSYRQLKMGNIAPLSGGWGETEITSPACTCIKTVWGLHLKVRW
jgi:hypothetical protein